LSKKSRHTSLSSIISKAWASFSTLHVQTVLAKITAVTPGDSECPQGSETVPLSLMTSFTCTLSEQKRNSSL